MSRGQEIVNMQMVLSKEAENIMYEYYNDNAFKMKNIVRSIIKRFGDLISQKDEDDFFSQANEQFLFCIQNWDSTKSKFDTYFINCMINAARTIVTRKNTKKRYLDTHAVSIFDVMSNDELEIKEVIEDKTQNIEKILELDVDEAVYNYYNSLSDIQRQIVDYRLAGYTVAEISELMGYNIYKIKHEVKMMRSLPGAEAIKQKQKRVRKVEQKTEIEVVNTETETLDSSLENTPKRQSKMRVIASMNLEKFIQTMYEEEHKSYDTISKILLKEYDIEISATTIRKYCLENDLCKQQLIMKTQKNLLRYNKSILDDYRDYIREKIEHEYPYLIISKILIQDFGLNIDENIVKRYCISHGFTRQDISIKNEYYQNPTLSWCSKAIM